MPMIILVCNTMLLFCLLLTFPVVLPLVLTSKKRRKTVLQRLGSTTFPLSQPKACHPGTDHGPIWVHALSVGEVISSIELVKALRENIPHRKMFFSASTATGIEEARKLLLDQTDLIFFYPYDLLWVVRKILRRVSPSVFVLVESDIWPTFLLELKKMDIPAVLVNARLSPSSSAGYKRLSFLMKPVLNSLHTICVQSKNQGRRFVRIGVNPEKICVTGNLKFDKPACSISTEDMFLIKKNLAIPENKKIFLAGSTHTGEELILLESFIRLRSYFSELALVIAPRNPERSDEVCRLAFHSGLTVKKMSRENSVSPDVVVIDTLGVLNKLYALSDAAFVGGSLVSFGGHNPLEPAAFAKPILFGPDMSDFPEISQMLLDAGGAVEVKNAEDICQRVRLILANPATAREMGQSALGVFQANQGAVEKTVAVIKTIETALTVSSTGLADCEI